jgi:hypothetical protein
MYQEVQIYLDVCIDRCYGMTRTVVAVLYVSTTVTHASVIILSSRISLIIHFLKMFGSLLY